MGLVSVVSFVDVVPGPVGQVTFSEGAERLDRADGRVCSLVEGEGGIGNS